MPATPESRDWFGDSEDIPLPEPPEDIGAEVDDAPVAVDAGAPASTAEFQADDIAAVVQNLAHQLDQVQALVRTLGWGVDHKTDDLRADLDTLAARVAELEPPPEDKEDDPKPQAWVDYANAQDWDDLSVWVDWLLRTYDLVQAQLVLPCWPAHRGVSEELAALRSSWRAAAISGRGKNPNEALIYWHDRWLHPALARLHTVFQHKVCEDGHHPTRAGKSTDPNLLAAAKTAATALTKDADHSPDTAGELESVANQPGVVDGRPR